MYIYILLQHPIEVSDTSDIPPQSDSDDSSEYVVDSFQSQTPVPTPEPSSRPKWVRRSVSAIRDFPPGCGYNVTPPAHAPPAQEPPAQEPPAQEPPAQEPPASEPQEFPAPVPYNVYYAMVLDRDYLYARNVELGRMLDQSVASSSKGYTTPSEDVRARVRALYDVAIQQATGLEMCSAEEARIRLTSLVQWLIPQLQFLGGNF